jgi:hypothetical protein
MAATSQPFDVESYQGREHHWRPDGEDLVTPCQPGDTSLVDRLALFARSKREIEAHTGELGNTGTGRYFIDDAAQLLSALRLWTQNQYRSDRVARDILEAGDVIALREVAHELRQLGTADAETASWTIAGMTNKSSGELMALAAYALRAL